jgi:hypothetical protein
VTCGRRVRWQGEVISAGREGREREPPMVVVPSHAAGRTGGRRKARAIASGAGGGTSSPPPLTRALPGRVRVHHPAFFYGTGLPAGPENGLDPLSPSYEDTPTRELLYFVPRPFSRVVPRRCSAFESVPFFTALPGLFTRLASGTGRVVFR